MKRVAISFFALLMFAVAGFAQGQPAAQEWADGGNINIVYNQNRWTELMQTVVKTPEQKDLFVNVSFECGLLTDNAANGDQVVRLVATLDGKTALPGRYEACGKTNELAKFGMACTDTNNRNGKASWTECNLTEAQLNDLRRTTRLVSGEFLFKDVGVGVHTLKVKVYLENASQAPAKGVVGDGMVHVTIVRLVKGS